MALHASTYEPKSRFAKWMDVRLPVGRLMHTQFVDFPPRATSTTGGRSAAS